MMKKYALSIVVMLLLVLSINAQVTNFNARDVGGTYIVDVTFAVDSADTAGAWNQTGFYPYQYDGVDFSSTPISAMYKNTGDGGGTKPYVTIKLFAIVTSTNYSIPVDTVVVTDSAETATATTLDLNNKRATGYWVEITNTGEDATGWLQLMFAKKEGQ